MSTDECNEALDDLDKDCDFLDAEDEVDFKDRELLDSNLAFKMAITDEDARKIIEGKQLKWLINQKDDKRSCITFHMLFV